MRTANRPLSAYIAAGSIVVALVSRNVVAAHFEVRAVYFYAAAICLWLLSLSLRRAISGAEKLTVAAIGPLLSGMVLAAYWGDPAVASLPVFFVLSAVLVFSASDAAIRICIAWLTAIFVVLSIGMVIAFIWASFGLPALAHFPSDRGGHDVYPFSVASAWVTGQVRMNGIFNEPGSFAFYLGMLAACRHLLRMDKRVTWALLCAGLTTVSIAHVLYMACHAVAEVKRENLPSISKAVTVLAVIGIGLLLTPVGQNMAAPLIERLFTPGEADQVFAGDNRSDRMMAALQFLSLDPMNILMGGSPSCSMEGICEGAGYLVGENPLTALARWGIVGSWHFYLLIGVLISAGLLRRDAFVCVGAALLLLQRPRIIEAGYPVSFLLVAACLAMYWAARRRKTYLASPASDAAVTA